MSFGCLERANAMTVSTTRSRSQSKVLGLLATALLMVTVSCSSQDIATSDPSISADVDRASDGKMEAVTLKGKNFTPNGQVLVTAVMAASGGNASPYVEQEVRADANGEFRWEGRPVPCPQPADYERGSWTRVIARDMTSGISGSEVLEPGKEPDCRP